VLFPFVALLFLFPFSFFPFSFSVPFFFFTSACCYRQHLSTVLVQADPPPYLCFFLSHRHRGYDVVVPHMVLLCALYPLPFRFGELPLPFHVVCFPNTKKSIVTYSTAIAARDRPVSDVCPFSMNRISPISCGKGRGEGKVNPKTKGTKKFPPPTEHEMPISH